MTGQKVQYREAQLEVTGPTGKGYSITDIVGAMLEIEEPTEASCTTERIIEGIRLITRT